MVIETDVLSENEDGGGEIMEKLFKNGILLNKVIIQKSSGTDLTSARLHKSVHNSRSKYTIN